MGRWLSTTEDKIIVENRWKSFNLVPPLSTDQSSPLAKCPGNPSNKMARYVKFTASGSLEGYANAAEIGVIGKRETEKPGSLARRLEETIEEDEE